MRLTYANFSRHLLDEDQAGDLKLLVRHLPSLLESLRGAGLVGVNPRGAPSRGHIGTVSMHVTGENIQQPTTLTPLKVPPPDLTRDSTAIPINSISEQAQRRKESPMTASTEPVTSESVSRVPVIFHPGTDKEVVLELLDNIPEASDNTKAVETVDGEKRCKTQDGFEVPNEENEIHRSAIKSKDEDADSKYSHAPT